MDSDTNFAEFLQSVEKEVKQAREEDYTLGLCLIFLDDLPAEGDAYNPLFTELGYIIADKADVIDIMVPYSFMNLAVIMRKTLPVDVVGGAERIRNVIEKQTFEMNGREFTTTASIGIASFPKDADSFQALVDKAVAALNEAKATGNCVVDAK